MFRTKDKVKKISNIFFFSILVLSVISIVSLIATGPNVEGRTEKDFYINLIMLIVYFLTTCGILYSTNKLIEIYKDEYPTSRKVYNLFVCISAMSIVIMFCSLIVTYVYMSTFSVYSLLCIFLGYIPIYVVATYIVSKGKILNKENDSNKNIMNLIAVIIIMNYAINAVVLVLQMLFDATDIIIILPNLCWAFIWIFIVLVAYKLVNKEA